MFEPIEVWGIIDPKTKTWYYGHNGTFWTLDKQEARDRARSYELCEVDSVVAIPDIIIARIPEATEALKNLLEIRRLRNLVKASEHEIVKGWNNRER